MNKETETTKWDWEISSRTSWWHWGAGEIWAYRHLLVRLVRKDFLLNYQQTLLGPLWILLQPLLTLFTFIIVFNKMVGISTGGLPPVLFYTATIILWNFFSDSFTGAAFTFQQNASVFTKVYFPRLIVPLSVLTAFFIRFLIQFLLLIALLVYFILFEQFEPVLSGWILFLPFAVMMTGLLSLSLSLIFSVLTAKYRDLSNVIHLGVRLLMFFTPVIYPVSLVPDKIRWLVNINPLSPLFEAFRYGLLGEGSFTISQLLYSFFITLILLLGSVMLFQKTGDRLLDIV